MSYRDLRCRCCPSLNSFRVGRLIVCISPHPDLSAGAPTPAASVTTSVFAPQPAEVVTPFLEAALCAPEANPVTSNGGCPGTESTALDPPTEVLSGKYGAAGSPANAPDPERDDFGATNSVSDGVVRGSLPSGESEPLVTSACAPSEFTSGACEGNGSNADGSKTADGSARNKSSDGPASISPGRIIREGRETASHVLAVARYPSPGRTFCIGCDAPADGFFCDACEISTAEFGQWSDGELESFVTALEANWLRAQGSCGEALADSTRNQLSMASRLTPPSPQDSNTITEADWLRAWHFNPAISSEPPSPVTAEASMHSGVSAFSFIDIPEFLPRKSNLLEMS